MILHRARRVPAHLRRGRLHLYGVGAGKSGTMTLARMFGHYRAAHEAGSSRFLPVAVDVLTGRCAPDSRHVRFELRRRRARFHLEVDSATFLNPVAGTLASVFPTARFVLTLRDCFSWLDSQVEWDLRYPNQSSPQWAPFAHALFDQHPVVFAPEEAPLRDAGLRPVASYLRAWSKQNTAVLREVPSERLLVVRTEDLSGAADTLAQFVDVPVRTVHPTRANANRDRTGVLSTVPRDFIVERAKEHCAAVMEKYWGADWRGLEERLPVREPGRGSEPGFAR